MFWTQLAKSIHHLAKLIIILNTLYLVFNEHVKELHDRRTTESTSLGRASASDKANVSVVFKKLGLMLDKDKFSQVICLY